MYGSKNRVILSKFSFLKFNVMGATGIDFVGIAHVKVEGHCALENIGVL